MILAAVWQAVENLKVGQHIIHLDLGQVGACLLFLQQLKILMTADQAVHIDNGPVTDEVGSIATACHSDDTARFGMFLQKCRDIHVRIFGGPSAIRHGVLDIAPVPRPHKQAVDKHQAPDHTPGCRQFRKQEIQHPEHETEDQHDHDQLDDPVPLLVGRITEHVIVKDLQDCPAQEGNERELSDSCLSLIRIDP